jgi:acetyl-CoA synthetase
MSQQRTGEVTEAEIAVHWQEEAHIHPPKEFAVQANLTDKTVFDRFSLDNFPDCFKEYANLLDWYRTWDVTLDTSKPPFWKWFVGGRINASYNCVDRHLAKHKNETAIHFVPEPEREAIQHITYQELYVRVNEVAALLQDFCGLKKGDRVPNLVKRSCRLLESERAPNPNEKPENCYCSALPKGSGLCLPCYTRWLAGRRA